MGERDSSAPLESPHGHPHRTWVACAAQVSSGIYTGPESSAPNVPTDARTGSRIGEGFRSLCQAQKQNARRLTAGRSSCERGEATSP